MIEASKKGCLGMLKLLLNHGACVKARDNDGRSALTVALARLYSIEEQFLLEHVVDRNDLEVTARLSVIVNKNLKFVKILLGFGADVNAQDAEGSTALIEASIKANLEVVKVLLNYGAGVDARNKNERTALIEASFYDKLNYY